jgi:hypothetical protein
MKHAMKLLSNELHEADGVRFCVSFAGPNPTADEAFTCQSAAEASRLKEFHEWALKQYTYCPQCTQHRDAEVSGEYPCQTCGKPRTHDE